MECSYEVPSSVLVFFLLSQLMAVYMLQDVKKEHLNKLGSYQEIVYFYT